MKLRVLDLPLLQFCWSTPEDGLWFDHDRRGYNKKGVGILFKIRSGMAIRHLLRPKYWLRSLRGERFPSAWKEFDPKLHSIIKCWFPILPFFSICIGGYGMYLGFKHARIDDKEQFKQMFPKEQIEKDAKVLVATASLRSTRW